MISCTATYYDGRTAISHTVSLQITDDGLTVHGHDLKLCYQLDKLRLSSPLGSMNRTLFFPDGGRCELSNGELCDLIDRTLGGNTIFQSIHRWENSLKRAAIVLTITIAAVWLFINNGIPLLASQVTQMIPAAIEVRTGEETLALLDRALLRPTQLESSRQTQLKQLFDQLLVDLGDTRPYSLQFRTSPSLGANALALPGGTVILTDELVSLAESDQELLAVLAHEIGHIKHRHSLRMVIQNTSAGFLVAALTGDLLSTTSLSAALPGILVDAKFSRDMEREADHYAVHYLTEQHIPLSHFSAILNRLDNYHATGADQERVRNWTTYLQSHPSTAERISILNLPYHTPQIRKPDSSH